ALARTNRSSAVKCSEPVVLNYLRSVAGITNLGRNISGEKYQSSPKSDCLPQIAVYEARRAPKSQQPQFALSCDSHRMWATQVSAQVLLSPQTPCQDGHKKILVRYNIIPSSADTVYV